MKHILILYATLLVCAQTSSTPQEIMVDVTNDFGVCILQLVSSRRENIAFSPYGVMSVGLVLYEGASGTTAAEIHNTLRLPWDNHVVRIGFRDIHRHLKSYFTNDGFLRGLVLSRPNVILHWNYTRQLQFYGFDLKPADKPTSTTQTKPMNPTLRPTVTSEGTTISTQLPTTTLTIQQQVGQTNTENVFEPPTSTQGTDASTIGAESIPPGEVTKVPSTNPPLQPGQTTNPQTQETEKASTAQVTMLTTGKDVEETQKIEDITTTIQTRPITTTDSITADGNNQQTEEVTRAIETTTKVNPKITETENTEGTSKVTSTETGNIQTEKINTTPIVQTTASPQTETRTTGTISETLRTETTMAATDKTMIEMEGRSDSDNSAETSQPKVPTTEMLTVKTELTSVSTSMPSTTQTIIDKNPETISTLTPGTTKAELSKSDESESGTTMIYYTNPTSAPTTQAIISEKVTEESTELRTALTLPAESGSTNTETEEKTTTAESSSETMSTTPTSSTSPMGTETETTNEITTQQTSSETPNDESTLRRRRAIVHYQRLAPEHREGISNWVPHYQDPRWNYHAPLENWFFSYYGGEKVPIITYSAYLPFAYLADLATLALQLPLDDPRYYMLILLPQERNGLEKLLYSLQWCPIRGIVNQLKLTAVYATVPVFTVVKHVNLVPALAKLGILSVFDPSTADLSAMSPEKGIFVRTIEQVVTVSLRKYFANYRWFEAKPEEVEQHFIANHPFAYFVLDKETQVTLMTGTIVNPTAYNQ